MALLQLPLDIQLDIIKRLNLSDLRNVMLTCKTLRELIINSNYIWRSISRNKLIIHSTINNSQSATLSCYNQSRISHNWCRGIYRNKIILYHNTKYMPWLKFYNSQALVLSAGSELRCYYLVKKNVPNCKVVLWRLEVPKVKRNDVRTNDISRFVMKDEYIACGNRDGCVAVYKMEDIFTSPRLMHHIKDCHDKGQVEVTAVEIISKKNNSCIITASEHNSKLCFWYSSPDDNTDRASGSAAVNEFNYRKREVILPNCIGVRCLAADGMEDNLAIGLNGNSKPQLLDVTTGQLLLTADVPNDSQATRDIGWLNKNNIMFVTHSGKLQIIDIRTNDVVYNTMDPFQSTLYCVKSDGHYAIVVGSSEYSRCVLYDWRNCARHVQMYFTQKQSSPIYSLDFDATKLIAAADRSIAALNFNVSAAAVKFRDYSHTFEFVNR